MRSYAFLLAGSLATGFLLLAGCQSSNEPTTQPTMMSNQPGYNETNITPEMQRFDSGIGDTATQTGGGGNGER